MGTADVSLILTEKQKYDKYGNASTNVCKIFEWYESMGHSQVMSKDEKYRKLHNLREGKINIEDYIDQEVPTELSMDVKEELDETGLNFYPIIPNVCNAVIAEAFKQYNIYNVRSVSPENTNDILDSLNSQLRSTLIEKIENVFFSQNPNATEEQYNLLKESEEYQKHYTKEFRTEIEKWGNHIIRRDSLKFDLKDLEMKCLDHLMITENPVIHVNCIDDNYYPEDLNGKDCFYLKSPKSEDYSEGMMFGWFEYADLGSVITKYASLLNSDQVELLESWVGKYYNTGMIVNNEQGAFTGNRLQDQESTQNYLTFQNMMRRGERRYDDLNGDLLRQTTIYFLLPRKVGKLMRKSEQGISIDLVDETFKVTEKPKYKKGEKKDQFSLLSGEHVEWFYVNELWKGIKIDVNSASSFFQSFNVTTPTRDSSIWVSLEKHKIQYSSPNFRYGVSIPVHGGALSNYYNNTTSFVEKMQPWQVFYNWIWNRNQQLLATEVGKFFAFNQNAIPHESLDGSWGKNNLLKYMVTARDTGFGPLDTSLSNMGQSAMQIHGGIGQVVDLNKTSDIIEKAQLATLVKKECYAQAGLTEEYLFGNISPYQSGQSVAQGMQRSSNQILHLFRRTQSIMKKVLLSMLQTAQYIESKNPYSEISYLTSDGMRVIFNMATEKLLLHNFDIYIESNLSDIPVLERIKSFALSNNTLGADSYEISQIETSKSVPELMVRLKEISTQKRKEAEQIRKEQSQQQQMAIQSAEKQKQMEIEAQKARDERNHQKDIMVAQIRALGYAEGDADSISKEIMELQSANLIQQKFYADLESKRKANQLKMDQNEEMRQNNMANRDLKERIDLKKLAQKDRELDIREEENKASLKRTKVLD